MLKREFEKGREGNMDIGTVVGESGTLSLTDVGWSEGDEKVKGGEMGERASVIVEGEETSSSPPP